MEYALCECQLKLLPKVIIICYKKYIIHCHTPCIMPIQNDVTQVRHFDVSARACDTSKYQPAYVTFVSIFSNYLLRNVNKNGRDKVFGIIK